MRNTRLQSRALLGAAIIFCAACSPGDRSTSPARVLSGGVPGLFSVASCIPAPSGMVNWWPGDRNALDRVGGQHGTLMGDATFAPGWVADAFSFDGSGDWVDFGTGAGQLGTGDFTVDLWAYHHVLGGEQILIERWNQFSSGAARGWSLVKLNPSDPRGGGRLFFVTTGASKYGGQGLLQSPEAVLAGVWYHVAVTRAGNHFTMYLDGQIVDESDLSADLSESVPLVIGRRNLPDLRGFYLNGMEDEIEIHNRALTAREIGSIYSAGGAGKCKTPVTQTVAIDVMPGSDNNPISCVASPGAIPVAILTTADLDAAQVDVATVRFGAAGTEASEAHGRGHLEDVDGDGDVDMLLHFRRNETGLACGGTAAQLTGRLLDGREIKGSDGITTVPRGR